MPDEETLSLFAKLTAEMTAISAVVSELLVTECENSKNPSAHLNTVFKNVKEYLDASPFGSDWNAKTKQMASWARMRAELIFLRTQAVVAKRG